MDEPVRVALALGSETAARHAGRLELCAAQPKAKPAAQSAATSGVAAGPEDETDEWLRERLEQEREEREKLERLRSFARLNQEESDRLSSAVADKTGNARRPVAMRAHVIRSLHGDSDCEARRARHAVGSS
jgi:hypothetical protein